MVFLIAHHVSLSGNSLQAHALSYPLTSPRIHSQPPPVPSHLSSATTDALTRPSTAPAPQHGRDDDKENCRRPLPAQQGARRGHDSPTNPRPSLNRKRQLHGRPLNAAVRSDLEEWSDNKSKRAQRPTYPLPTHPPRSLAPPTPTLHLHHPLSSPHCHITNHCPSVKA